MLRTQLFLIVVTLFSINIFHANASSFTFKHPTCKVKVLPSTSMTQKLKQILSDQLERRNFDYSYLSNQQQIGKDEMYLLFTKTLSPKKLYKDCIISIVIKVSKSKRVSKNDKVKFEKEIKRSFPRLTFKGSERCRLALKNVFIHIPQCIKPGE